MKKRHMILFWGVIFFSVTACGMFGGDEPPPSESTVAVESAPAADVPQAGSEEELPTGELATPTEPAVEDAQILLGEAYRSEAGGYSFLTIIDASIEEYGGSVYMIAPGGVENYGPAVIMAGEYLDEEQTLDEAFDWQLTNMGSSNTEFSEPQDVTVGGAPGRLVEVSGTQDEQEMAGRIIVVLVNPHQMFMIGGIAPLADWDGFSATF